MPFNEKNPKSKTGIYILENSNLVELEIAPGNGSINSIIESIGFSPNQVKTVLTFDSIKIEVIGFKIFSREVLFAVSKNNRIISLEDILKEKNQIDWSFEYSSLNVEEILNDGIEAQNLSFDFLKEVLDLTKENTNLYKSEKFDLYLHFENNLLNAYSSSEWDNSSSKYLKGLSASMYNKMVKEAKDYHDNDIDAMQEVNNQSSSILVIPKAMENEFIKFHIKPTGNINFYNLLITHYTQDCELTDFIFMNKGRYKQLDILKYEAGNFIYEFNDLNRLEKIYSR